MVCLPSILPLHTFRIDELIYEDKDREIIYSNTIKNCAAEVHVKAQDDPATSEKLFNRTSKKIDKEWSESKTSKLYMKDDKVIVSIQLFAKF